MTIIVRRLSPARLALLSVLGIGVALIASSGAQAQQIGKAGWEPSARSNSLAAQFQFQKKQNKAAAGMDALTQYVTNYNSSSTSIGNYTEVIQTLGDNASGTVNQSATQDSSGTQDASSSAADNQTTNGSLNATISGKGKGDKNALISGSTGQ